MQASPFKSHTAGAAITPSPRTRHAELLRLCARIGYSPPGHA
ncbi:capsid protein [Nitratireductor sp. StC3]|nr:capsid protein [Nitratireductor sp. StC3]